MCNKLYFNYHRHTYNSNTATIDCTVSNDDYAERAIELGHKWLASTEHGGAVGFVDAYMSAKKHNLHYVHAGEFYFVKDRSIDGAIVVPKHIWEGDGIGVEVPEETKFQKDKSNYHLMIVAKTRRAMEELNYIMTEANMNGYYYKPRIDLELLKLLPKGEYFVTTACIGGVLRDYVKNKELFEEMISIIGKENLFLEVQPHATIKQIEYNNLMLELSKIYGLKLIAGCDSHMIHEKQVKDRDYLLHSKGLIYEDEEGWYLDYPTYDVLFERFRNQNIWEDSQISEFIENTLLLANTEEIIIDTKMKIPTIFPDKDRNWRLNYLKKLMFNSWEKYKWTVPKNRWIEYVNEILLEFNIIELTKMEDYFISNYHIIKRGIELGGILTRSSRGSGASFFINMLLGFTTIDRLQSKLPMLPQRFMSISRIIENNSSPDIDFNIYNRECFLQAQDELFGKNSNFFMVAWGTLGLKSAFKMLCRAMEIDVDTANEVSKLITTYEFDKKHNEHAKIEDYISNPRHLELIKYSKKYMGIVDNMSAHPCATILSNEDIRRKFGVLKSPNGVMVANVTGKQAEKLGYLKNDFLIVDVVDLNDRLYKRVGMEFVGANELYKLVEQNPELWNLFANGYTLCLNQMESSGTTAKMMRYKPSNLWELSNSISAIRPSSASIYAKYEKREHFDYGIPFIDNLLQGEFIDNSFMIYQEQQMILLATIGIKPDKIVSVIKAISKKEKAVIDSISEEFHKKLFDLCIKHGETDEAKVTSVVGQLWTVFVDSAEYGFNAPHAQATATDCLHTALIKHLFPIEFYEVALEKYSSDKKTEKVALLKNEAFRYKGILVTPMRYGQNNTKFTANKDKNEIWQSLMGVKALNNNTAETIYEISKEFKDIEFFDLYIVMKARGLSKTHIENLIKIGYFNDFKKTKREMLWLTSNYDDFNKKQINKDKVDEFYEKINSDTISILDFYKELKALSSKETAKLLKFEEGVLPKFIFGLVKIDTQDKLEELFWECQLLGTTIDDLEEEFMLGRIMKYNPSKNSILFKHIRGNSDRWLKIKSSINVKEKDFIFISSLSAYTYRGREYYTVEECVNLTETYK